MVGTFDLVCCLNINHNTCEYLQIVSQISLVDEGYGSPPGGSDVVVVGIEHLPDQMSVCVATGGGDVLLWNTTNNQVIKCYSIDLHMNCSH